MSGSMMSRNTAAVLVAAGLAAAGSAAGCGGGGEERSLIRNFFTASRVNDRTTLGNIAMVAFDPAQDGSVGGFDVETVGEEQRRPLRMRELGAAVAEARQAEQDHAGRMKAYQDENLDAIARVVEAERAGEAVRRRDQSVQEEWRKFRDEDQDLSRAQSDAESALAAESAVAQVSAYDPNNPIDVQAFEGELVTKEVTINATVDRDGSSEERMMAITLQKVELDGPDGMIDGRWVIADIQ